MRSDAPGLSPDPRPGPQPAPDRGGDPGVLPDDAPLPGRYAMALATLAGLALAVVVGCLALQVLGRTVLVRPMAWTGELARFAAVWATMLSAAAAFEMGALHRVDLLTARLGPRALRLVRWVAAAMVAALLVFLIRHGHAMGMRMLGQRSSVMGISMAWVHASVPVTAALMTVTLLRRLWRGEGP
ncbi:MAG: TRAP transporter small permease subunit [Alkalilacustris sp.]